MCLVKRREEVFIASSKPREELINKVYFTNLTVFIELFKLSPGCPKLFHIVTNAYAVLEY